MITQLYVQCIKDKFNKKWKFSHYPSPPCWWRVRGRHGFVFKSRKKNVEERILKMPEHLPLFGSATKVNGVYQVLRPIQNPGLVEICSIVFVQSCWPTNQQTKIMHTGENITPLVEVIMKVWWRSEHRHVNINCKWSEQCAGVFSLILLALGPLLHTCQSTGVQKLYSVEVSLQLIQWPGKMDYKKIFTPSTHSQACAPTLEGCMLTLVV